MLYRTSSNLDDTLDQCIDRLQGGVDIATCLQENQLLADELKPLLQVAAVLPSLPAPQLSQQARNRIRKQMLQAVKTQEQAARRYERRRSGSFFGFAMRFAVVLVVVMLAMGSGVAAAQSSVPGDALYPVKRGSEQVRLAMATRQADRAALHLQLAETRFAEINTLLERGKQPDSLLLADLSGEYDAAWNDIHTLPVADSAPLYAVYVATLEHHVDLIRTAAATASPEQGVQFAATLAASESALVRAHNDEWQNEDQRPTPNTPGVTPGNTGGQNSGSRPDTPSSTVQPGSNGNNGANQGNNGQNSATPPATNNGNGGQNDNNGGSQIGTPPNPNPTNDTNNNGNGGQNDNGSQIDTPPNPKPTNGTNNNGNNGNNGNGGQNDNGNNGNNSQNGNGSQTDTPANPQPGQNPGNNGNGNGNGSDSRPDTPANPGATDGPSNGNGNNSGQNDNGNNGNNGQNDNGNNGNNGNDGSATAAPQATTEAAPTEAALATAEPALATAEPVQPTDAPTDSPAENGNNGNGNNGNGNNDNGNNGNGGDGSNGQNGNGNGNGNGRNRP